jgi:Ca2+-binding RTX toxin-like protein
MTFATESVTEPGSGLVFINSYDDSVSGAYRTAIINAEHELQDHFTNAVTVNVSFTLAPLSGNAAAQNTFTILKVSYADFAAALRAHAVSADDQLAVNGLPASDPSNGVGFEVTEPQAVILGLFAQSNDSEVTVTLNSDLPWTFGQDAVGALEHEITEGAFGRIGSLGIADKLWAPLDLFRFTAGGARDFTGGKDGAATFFGVDANHLTSLRFHNSVNALGTFDKQDLGDWDFVRGDAFGPGGPSSPGVMSATDLRVLDILGWNATAFAPAPDDFANTPFGAAQPLGTLAVGGSAHGVLQAAGDRDVFAVQLVAGQTYTITETGSQGGGGDLADPFLRLDNMVGETVATNDDVVSGTNPDSTLTFTPTVSGTYFVEAGAFADGYAGGYTVAVAQSGTAAIPGGGADNVTASATMPDVQAGAGDDTIAGFSGPDYLRGGDGDDSIVGGAGFDDINGNKGDDVIDGGAGGDDWLVGGQGNDAITGHVGRHLIYGNLGNDTLHGGTGTETMLGGQGDDVIVGGSAGDFISGDRGSDTLTGGGGADIFHTFSGAGADLVTDFSLAQGDRVQIDAGTTFTISQSGADAIVILASGDELILQNVQAASLPAGTVFLA